MAADVAGHLAAAGRVADVDRVLQVERLGASAMLSSQLVRGAQLKVYKGLPHGMATTHHDVINADLLAFFKA